MATRYDPLSGKVITTPDPAPTPARVAGASGVQQALSTSTPASTVVKTTTSASPIITGGTTEAAAAAAAKAKAAADAKVAADAVAAADKAKADKLLTDAAAALKEKEALTKKDAFALITDTISTYGFNPKELSEITKFIQDSLLDPSMGPNQTVLAIRNLDAYKTRFAGNATRVANGLSALSEANYINQEDAMNQYLTAHGVANLGTRSTLANLIGSGISATDVNTRAALAVDSVTNADPEILQQLKTYYPEISKGDLTSYFLDPANTLPALQQKVTTGQIGAAFKEQNLTSDVSNMTDLAKYGVTQSQAIAGAGNIATVLPTASKLGDIYGASGIKYDQAAGQSEFFKSDAAAALKRKQLASMERAQFQTDSGVNAQQGYGIANSIQGKF